MEQFPNKGHVWVRSRALRTYLHASADGARVCLLPTRASINATWAVQVHQSEHGSPYVLLQGAAYGRYLAATDLPAPFCHSGYRTAQLEHCDLPAPQEDSVLWRVIPAASGDDVLLRHFSGRYLRANGIGRRNTGVTVEKIRRLTTMAQWEVEVIPASPSFPGIPGPIYESIVGDRPRRFLSGRKSPPLRFIRFVQADAEGEYSEDGWIQLPFRGNSIYDLRNEVANRVHINSFVMCVRSSLHAPLAPMLANLPGGTGNTLYIVVIRPRRQLNLRCDTRISQSEIRAGLLTIASQLTSSKVLPPLTRQNESSELLRRDIGSEKVSSSCVYAS